MKWNPTSVSAACLAVGICGFVAGKISNGQDKQSEADLLLSRAKQVSAERLAGGKTDGADSRSTGARNRNSSERTSGTFDERLVKMEEIIRGENALDRGRAMLSWIDSLAPEEFESAVERFRSLGLTEARMGEYAMLLTAWAELDPTAALAYTTEKTRGGMATGTVLTAWASRDPESAIAWAKANHEGDGANPYMIGIIRGLAETNPTRATELLKELPFSRERGDALQAMLPHLLKMGADSAKSWIAAIDDQQLRDGATARFAQEMAKTDPEGTATWLLSNLSDASTRSVDEVFGEWAKTDMAAAIASFEKLPEGGARERAMRGLISVEARENPQAAANLMNQYPDDVDDRLVHHFIWNSFDKAPQIAVGQISMVEDQGRQNRLYERALGAWLDRDQAAARSWINSASLPEQVVKSLANRNKP